MRNVMPFLRRETTMLERLKYLAKSSAVQAYKLADDYTKTELYYAIRELAPRRDMSRLERLIVQGADAAKVIEQAAAELPIPVWTASAGEAPQGENALGVQEILAAFGMAQSVDAFISLVKDGEKRGVFSGASGVIAVATALVVQLERLTQAFPLSVRKMVAARVKAEYEAGRTEEAVAEAALKAREEAIRQDERIQVWNRYLDNAGPAYFEDASQVRCEHALRLALGLDK